MRVLVVLILAVLSGCDASTQPTKTRLDEVTEAIAKRAEKAEEIFYLVLNSDLGREVRDKLNEAGTAVARGLDKAWNKLPPDVKDFVDTTTDKAAEAFHSGYHFVQRNLEPVVEKVTPVAKAAANKLIIAIDNLN